MEKKSIIEIIEIIGKQWPFLLTVFVIVVTILKWKTIWKFVTNMSGIKLKKGETEIELSQSIIQDNPAQKPVDINVNTNKSQGPSTQETNESILTLSECYLKLDEGKEDEANKLFTQIQSRAKPDEIIENEFTYLYYKFLNGKSNETEFKERLNQEISNEQKGIGYKFYGLSLKNSRQYTKAIEAFKMALQLTKNESEICNILTYMSQTYLDNNDSENAKKIIIEKLTKINEDYHKADLYYQLSKVYESQKDNTLKAIVLEKAATLKGNNTSFLFDSAYCYAETDFQEASISQYYNLLNINSKHASALNNQGVNFLNKELKFKSSDFYKRAIEVGSSLAAANLAYVFIEAGLENEADSLFKQFNDKPDVHKNLFNAQSKLVIDIETQQKSAERFLELGQNYSKFFNNYGLKYFEDKLPFEQVNEKWTDISNNTISVQVENSQLNIVWEVPNSAIGTNDLFVISGQLQNSACQITFDFPTTKNPDQWELILDKNKKPTRLIKKYNGFCYLDLPKKVIEILYKSDEGYKFLRFIK